MRKRPFLCAPRRQSTELTGGRGKRRPSLLLIEDNPIVIHFLSSAIEECGFTVVKTGTFAGFKRDFVEHLPDGVAMDLSLPDCEGTQIIEELAARGFGGLVLIISGLEADVIDEALQLGRRLKLHMAEPLAKPFRFDDLVRRLSEVTTSAAH